MVLRPRFTAVFVLLLGLLSFLTAVAASASGASAVTADKPPSAEDGWMHTTQRIEPGMVGSEGPGMGRILSDTYERELSGTMAGQHYNDARMRDLDSEYGERLLPDCPFDGTFHQLRRFGHRLWFESDTTLARACFKKATSLYLNPTNTIQPNEPKIGEMDPTEHPRYKNIFVETYGTMHEKEFEDFGHVVGLIQRRTERIYSLPWAAMRPALHDQMLKDGTLIHDPRLRAIAVKRKQEQAKRRATTKKKRRAGNKGKGKGKGKGKRRARGRGKGKARGKGKGKHRSTKANQRRLNRKTRRSLKKVSKKGASSQSVSSSAKSTHKQSPNPRPHRNVNPSRATSTNAAGASVIKHPAAAANTKTKTKPTVTKPNAGA